MSRGRFPSPAFVLWSEAGRGAGGSNGGNDVSESNKELVRRVEEAWAANDLAALDELIAPDLVSHDAIPGAPPGLAGARLMS